ncbi:hypothetical protein TWF696_004511 [Orbilia brochopaga]|uniref:C2H2-type domain-containing protein n=1 Tax=Orbilia brochopaga TaxID=3140254 RepID=A0AAV9V756_9PEZI
MMTYSHPSSYHTFDHFPPSSSSLKPRSPSAASRPRHLQASSSRAQGYYGAPSGSAGSRSNPRSLPPYISLQRPSEPASPATIATTISSHSTPSPSPSRPTHMPAVSNTDFTLFDDAMVAAAQDVANDSATKGRTALDVSSSMSDNSSGIPAYSAFPIIVPHDVPYSNYAQSAIYGNYSTAGNDVPSNFYTLGQDEQSSSSQQQRQNQRQADRYLHPLPYSANQQKTTSSRHNRAVASQLKNMEVEPIENVPALSPTSRRQGNFMQSGNPASPHTTAEAVADNSANPRYPSGASICEGNNLSINTWLDEYLQKASDMHPPMPKLGRTYSDAVQDELYNPEPPRDLPDYSKKTPAWYSATSESKGDTTHSFPRIFHEAQQRHQHDLSQSGSPQHAGGDRSPFRRNSPFHPTNNPNLPQVLNQQNQIAMAMAFREQIRKEAEQTVAPKTISPRDSLLEYREPDSQQSQMALFPPLQDNRLLGTQDDSMSHVGSLHGASSHDGSDLDDFQSMATSRRASMANSTVSSHLDVPRFGYMQQSSFDPISAGTYYYPDATGPLAASSLPLGEAPGVYIKEEDHHISRPLDTSANTGTYTCTYTGCGQRFTTSTKLQKHRREAHRKSVPSGNSVSTAAAIACRNAQPGPHRCMRVNPSTGKPCNTVFSRPYDLTRHEDTIHNTAKAKVRCEICDDDKFFSRSDALVRHRRVKHGIH